MKVRISCYYIYLLSMASNENPEDNEASSTKQVLDYYKKFSQNKALPRYFSGSPLSYLPEFTENVNEEPHDVIVKTGVDIVIALVDEEKPAAEPDAGSRANSVMSNRKLEWDNLADIGYDNLQKVGTLKKTSSLPTLLPDLAQFKTEPDLRQLAKTSDLPKAHKSTSSSTGSNDANVKLILLNYSSSSSVPVTDLAVSSSPSSSLVAEEKKEIYSSSSSNGKNVQPISISSSDSSGRQRISNFSYTLSYLKQKIGLPGAHSTPNTVEEEKKEYGITETPMLKRSEKPVKNVISSIDEKTSMLKSTSKNIEKRIKPQKIEKPEKKIVTLCLTKPVSVECISNLQKCENKVIQVQRKNVNIAVQTDNISEKELVKIIAKCQDNLNQSVVFVQHTESDKNTCYTQTGSDVAASNCESFEYIKNMDLYDPKESNIEENLPLKSEFVSNLKRSQKRDDLKVASSENNSSPIENVVPADVTMNTFDNGNDFENKIYLLQKLLKSKKYDNATKKRYIKKLIQKMTESKYLEESSNSSELFFPKKSTPSHKLEQAPVSTNSSSSGSFKGILKKTRIEKVKVSPTKKQLDIQTYTNEILLENSQKDGCKSDNNKEPISSSSKCCETTSESSSTKSLSYHNWKDDKTISERIFEGRHLSQGDGNYLDNMVNKERENQINWISNEIDHLGKLKSLLEAHAKKDRKAELVPKNFPKTTSVYVLSEGSDNEKCSKKKYVIETEVTAQFGGKRKFQIDGKKYTIGQLSDQEQTSTRAVLGDIEVIAGDNTMNIKVTTFCEICKRSPCVCVTEFLEGVCNPFVCQNKVIKENICQNCKEVLCQCANSVRYKKTICLICHTTPCICKSDTLPKKCKVCNLQLCICPGSSVQPDVYNGQFIPIASEGPKTVNGAYSTMCSESKSSSGYPVGCIVCGKWPCICEKVRKESNRNSSKEDLSENVTVELNGNSLKKVFENCRCNVGKRCNCEFVSKLYKHFNISQVKDNNYESKDCQTENDEYKYEYQHIAIQTQVDMEHKDMQTSKSEDTKMLQTEMFNQHKCVGTQVEVETVFESIQTTLQQASDILPSKNDDNKVEEAVIDLKKPQRPRSAETQTNQASKRIGTDKILSENKRVQPFRPRSAEVQISMKSRKTSKKTETDNILLQNKTVQLCRPRSAKTQTFTRNVKTVSSQAGPAKEDIMTNADSGKTVKFVPEMLNMEEIESISSSTSTSERDTYFNVEVCKCGFKKSRRIGKDVEVQTSIKGSEKELKHSKNAEAQVNIERKQRDNEIQSESISSSLEKKTRTKSIETQINTKSSDSSRSSNLNGQENIKNMVQVKMKNEEEMLRNDERTDMTTGSVSADLSVNEISTPTSFSTTTTLNNSSWTICTCCKQPISLDAISILRQGNMEYPFCPLCIKKRPILTTVCYSGPEHVCTCCVSDNREMGPTAQQNIEEYCTCTKPSRHRHSQYCAHCQNKLRRTLKSKNGIAYTLTLECESPSRFKSKKRKKKQLEEIKVKIPEAGYRKKHKDKVNLIKKDKEVRNGKHSDSVSTVNTETNGQNVERKSKKKSTLTLQEHLMYNRPDFINSAEYRRQAVLSSRLGREITKDEEKLKLLEDHLQNNKIKKQTKLFSEQEMRDITKRNYKKLPEVQQRMTKHREQRLKNADKLMVSIFAKKIQGCVLKGKSRFPIDSKVVNV